MDVSAGVSRDQLKSYVARIERLEEEKKGIADDIKEVYAEAKAFGFDVKTLRKVISLRKQDANERAEQEAILDVYLAALGMLPMEEAIAEAVRKVTEADREPTESGSVVLLPTGRKTRTAAGFAAQPSGEEFTLA